MNQATRATSKMSVHDLRDLAKANGITKGLYGTSKQALVMMIDRAQAEAKAKVAEEAKAAEKPARKAAKKVVKPAEVVKPAVGVSRRPSAYRVADAGKVKWGFLKALVDFCASRKGGVVTEDILVKKFEGVEAPSKGGATAPVTKERLVRYFQYCLHNGILEAAV